MIGPRRIALAAGILLCACSLLFAGGSNEGTAAKDEASLSAPLSAMDKAAQFYKGKTVRILVGHEPGGGYDATARLLAPALSELLGATVVVENYLGAGGIKAANYLYEKADQDGLTLQLMMTPTLVQGQLVRDPAVTYDLRKMNCLGNTRAYYSGVWITAGLPFKDWADMVSSGKKIRFAASNQASQTYWVPEMVLKATGLNEETINMVRGYISAPDELLAVVRGEVEATFLSYNSGSIASEYKAGTIRPMVYFSPERVQELPDVPTIYEVAPNLPPNVKFWLDYHVGTQKYRGAIYTNQNVPPERVEFLREALSKVMEKDSPVYRKIKAANFSPFWATAEDVQQAVNTWLNVDEEQVKYFRKVLGLE